MKIKLKAGMGGSRCGRGRRDTTGVLKEVSKVLRRREGKQECRKQMEGRS